MVCTLIAPAGGALGQQEPQRLPNILFIYLDDLGYGDVSCYNPDSKIQTPHVDRLAKQGLRFTDAHTPASICGPSRYGLMTGRYPWRRGRGGTGNGEKFRDVFIEDGRLTLASLLKKKGYNTAQFGKWGLRHDYSKAVKPGKQPGTKDAYDFPNKRLLGSQTVGFDYAWHMTHLYPLPGKQQIGHAKHTLENGLPIDPDMAHDDPHRWLPDSAEKVVEYINDYAGKAQNKGFGIEPSAPFFIYWDPPSPHLPIVPNPPFVGKSDAGQYGDFIVEIDHYIGKMLSALDRHNLAKNTLVIFSSDNGPENVCFPLIQRYEHFSMGQWRGIKRDMWEGGHRVPLIVRWPGVVEPGRVCDELVGMTDWMATLAEIVGQPLPQDAGEDSVSLLPLLKSPKVYKPVRDHLVMHIPSGRYGIRSGDWVYIDHNTGRHNTEPYWFREMRGVQPHNEPGGLYNLNKDPQQTTNVYRKEPQRVSALKSLLNRLLKKSP